MAVAVRGRPWPPVAARGRPWPPVGPQLFGRMAVGAVGACGRPWPDIVQSEGGFAWDPTGDFGWNPIGFCGISTSSYFLKIAFETLFFLGSVLGQMFSSENNLV